MTVELNFIEEEVPKITRVGGAGREAEPWETHIAPLKEEGRSSKSFRVWTYGKRTSAVSRMSSVRDRLTKAVPTENWSLAVRPVPGTEDAVEPEGAVDSEGTSIAGQSATQHGVYVQYNGTFTADEVAANAKAHAERSARVKAARAATQAKGESTEPIATDSEGVPTDATEPTAKERVAAAKAKATAAK
jgi:hypothetical protein